MKNYGDLKPMTYVDAMKEAIRRGYNYIDGRYIKECVVEMLLDEDKVMQEEPSHIIVNSFIIDLASAWEKDGNIYFLDY